MKKVYLDITKPVVHSFILLSLQENHCDFFFLFAADNAEFILFPTSIVTILVLALLIWAIQSVCVIHEHSLANVGYAPVRAQYSAHRYLLDPKGMRHDVDTSLRTTGVEMSTKTR